ncbi:uncharacterized protein DUF2313 [Aneurinibacillus soli]|uniref:Uncharacterized protein n=1 Tax=Aneurinibacillus soli TaxID=1500254 RepID=A0A0U5AYU7_9BACL|nr:putative phage tail protein [Aneurinibacillus soli]PYE62992.1 uncharacterized protein DUF2313 [Aneurinibacillus soli]BAU28949.1 hypothetical protein CB4_03126 [Aneurinibacillus soli]
MSVIVPLKYRKEIPAFYYEEPFFAYSFDAMDKELLLHQWRGRDICNQFFRSQATWGIVVWESMFKVEKPIGSIGERRDGILEAHFFTLPFTPNVLTSIANSVSTMQGAKAEEIFDQQIIRFIFQLEDTVNIERLRKIFEGIRPTHALGMEAVVTGTDAIPLQVEALSRYHDHEYLFCGDFYPEDDLEGRIYEESLPVTTIEREHTFMYPECNDFYPGEE